MRCSAKIVVVLSVSLSVGLHWALLQSLAWTGMFVENLGEASLSVALVKTFEEESKCRICHFIEDARGISDSGHEEYSFKVKTKLDFMSPEATQMIVEKPSGMSALLSPLLPETMISFCPPSPPPRALV